MVVVDFQSPLYLKKMGVVHGGFNFIIIESIKYDTPPEDTKQLDTPTKSFMMMIPYNHTS